MIPATNTKFSAFFRSGFFYFAFIFAVVYCYFFRFRTTVIYGDDVFIYYYHSQLHSLWQQINISISAEKFRPVYGLVMHLLIVLLGKNLAGYYVFNVLIQSINTYIFFRMTRLLIKSDLAALFFSFIFGLSRFSFYNITQLYNGGPLEGLAVTFTLLSIFFLLRETISPAADRKSKAVLLSLLFANLALYTHERYIVVFAFIGVVVVFSKQLGLPLKKKLLYAGLIGCSILLNIVIKKYIFSIPFLVGTGGTNISLSGTTITTFLSQAVLSIIQLNTGPTYLTGIEYGSLSTIDICLIAILIGTTYSIFVIYFYRSFADNTTHTTFIFACLLLLMLLMILPAIVTIRVEQRFLQGPFAIFVLLVAWAVGNLATRFRPKGVAWICAFAFLFIWVDAQYLDRGAFDLYMSTGERIAGFFKKGVDNNIVRTCCRNVFIMEKNKNPNAEGEITWAIGGGTFFQFYGCKNATVFYEDSSDLSVQPNELSNKFRKDSDQVLFFGKQFGDTVANLTPAYIKDSLKTFIKTY